MRYPLRQQHLFSASLSFRCHSGPCQAKRRTGKADQDAVLDAEPSSGAGMAISLARTLSGLALSTGRLQRAAVDYVKEVHPYLPVLLGKVRATGVVPWALPARTSTMAATMPRPRCPQSALRCALCSG